MSHYESLEITTQGRVTSITLNRPAHLNAFDAMMHKEFPVAIAEVAAEPRSDVIIITGAGRAFSSGGDIEWQQKGADYPELFEITVREAKQIVYALLDCEKPIIAKINGPAVGLGATVALLCDISFISDSTYISDPHVSIGMVAGDGGAVIWPQLIGFSRAKEYLFTGDQLTAAHAERIGLVNHCVPSSQLDQRVDDFAQKLVSQPQMALRYTKTTINIALRQLMSSSMDVGLAYESLTNVSHDHNEALEAFRQKRRAVFGTGVSNSGESSC